MIEYARRHRDFSIYTEQVASLQPKILVEHAATEEAKRLAGLAMEVKYALRRFQAFTRFSISPHGILYAEIEPSHFIEDLLLDFFAHCFPSFAILLSSPRGTFYGSYGQPLKRSRKLLPSLLLELEQERPLLKELEDKTFDYAFWHRFGLLPATIASR